MSTHLLVGTLIKFLPLYLVSGASVAVVDTLCRRVVRSFKSVGRTVNAMAFSSDGRWLLTADERKYIRVRCRRLILKTFRNEVEPLLEGTALSKLWSIAFFTHQHQMGRSWNDWGFRHTLQDNDKVNPYLAWVIHSSSLRQRGRSWNACLVYTMTSDGQQLMDKSVFFFKSQTRVVQIP